MRLIDVDEVLRKMQQVLDENQDKMYPVAYFAFSAIMGALQTEPTVDAVEVVRCRDCKHCFHLSAVHQDDISCSYFLIDYGITPDHFCAYGERRTDGKET